MKTILVLFAFGFLGIASAIEIKNYYNEDLTNGGELLDAHPWINETYTDDLQDDKMRATTYNRVHRHLKSIERQIIREMNGLERNEKANRLDLNNARKRLQTSNTAVTNALNALNLSKQRYKKALSMKNKYDSDAKRVHRSINKQRNYLSQEQKLVAYLKREVHNLRGYTTEHRAVVNELNKIERAINIQVRRLHNHYNNLLRKIRRSRNLWINRYNQYNKDRIRKQDQYNSRVSIRNRENRRYNAMLRKVNRIIMNISNQKKLYKNDIEMLNNALYYLRTNRPTQIRSLQQQVSSLRNRIRRIKSVVNNRRYNCGTKIRKIGSM